MNLKLLIRPEASVDISNAYEWYEHQRFGLGEDFILSLENAFGTIQRNSKQGPIVYKKIRRILIRRFPFGVYYLSKKDFILVIAVFHIRRDPIQWKKRTKN